MPKQGQRAEVNTFIQGLITEASPLNFPPNASKLEENFELFRDGTRRRRKGMDFEEGYNLRLTDYGPIGGSMADRYNSFEWNSVGGDDSVNFLVVQFSNTLYFFDRSVDDMSASGYKGSLFIASGGQGIRKFASLEGRLISVSGADTVVSVKYTPLTGVFSYEDYRILVRDFWGVQVPNVNTETDYYFRPDTYNANHEYNLRNQSWLTARKDKLGSIVDPIKTYFTEYGLYPSNSEVVWTGLQYQAVQTGTDPFERMYPALYKEVFAANPIASKGYFIIDLMERGVSRSTQYDLAVANNGVAYDHSVYEAPPDASAGGASCVVEYAGRVFYSGFDGRLINGDARSPNISNYVCFSQLVKTSRDIIKCYQEGDPTSREGSDIVDTDGGFLRISGADNILDMKYIGNSLIVLASNGIWSITGGSDYGFTATNYKVTQISAFGCSSPNSIVLQGDSVLYWGDGGIYSIAPDQFGSLKVSNLSQTTIQSFYDDLSQETRNTVRGLYDEGEKKVRWVYRTQDSLTADAVTNELVLDFTLSNFTLNTIRNITDPAVEVLGPASVNGFVSYVVITLSPTDLTKYAFTFSNYRDATFKDWKTVDGVGVDAKAFLLTGSQIAGDSAIDKQIPYIVMHFEKTETETDSNAIPKNQSSCLVRFYWDWAGGLNSNKVSALQQAYKYRKALLATPNSVYDNGFEVVSSKLKIRGSGRAFALYLETEPEKDCHVLGWNLTLNGNAIA